MRRLTRGKVLIGKGGFTIRAQTTATLDPTGLDNGAGETKAVAVTNASLGDYVMVSAPYDLQGITVTPYVAAAGTVAIRLQNETGGSIDLASGSWGVKVFA